MTDREKFLQTYANIPLSLRNEIIAVIEHEPVTWSSAKIEIENNTALGRKILEQLKALQIL